MWHEARMLWDTVAYHWDVRVMNYDKEGQMTLLAALGLEDIGDGGQLTVVVVIVCAAVAALAAWLRRSGKRRAHDPAGRAFARFCAALEATGVRREPWEGPQHFTMRAAAHFPSHAPRIRRIGELYTSLRYGKTAPAVAELVKEVRALVKAAPGRKRTTGNGADVVDTTGAG
jgi:hypothetical protein